MNTRKCWTAMLVGVLLLPKVGESADPSAEACQKGGRREKRDFDAAISAYAEAIRLDPKVPPRIAVGAAHTQGRATLPRPLPM